jgi:hypothetical protein
LKQFPISVAWSGNWQPETGNWKLETVFLKLAATLPINQSEESDRPKVAPNENSAG